MNQNKKIYNKLNIFKNQNTSINNLNKNNKKQKKNFKNIKKII